MSYKWTVAWVVIFGIFMSAMDSTIVNIAIPHLQASLGGSQSDVDWVITGYTLAGGISTPLTPFLSARLGLKRFYLILLAGFTISSAFCGLAGSLGMLITVRIIQGLAGACLTPMSLTILYQEFPPHERGAVVGALGIPLLLAPALGPTVGGYLVTYASWQLIFYINVPTGIIGFILSVMFLREYRNLGEQQQHFDILGFIFIAIGMSCTLYAFSDASTDGWNSQKVLSFLVAGICGLLIFIILELVIAHAGENPLLDLRLFRILSFGGGTIAYIMTMFTLFGGAFLVPIYLQNLRGLSAYDAGLQLLPQALSSMAASFISGRLMDKIGARPVILPGLLLLGVALWGSAHLTLQTPYSSFQWLLILRGLALGLAAQPLTTALLMDVKQEMVSQGTAINSVVRAVASSLAVAFLTTEVSSQTKIHYVHLAEQVTIGSPAALLLQRFAGYFQSHGMNQQDAMTAALQEMYKLLQLQANQLAINDAFFLSVIASIIAMIAVALCLGHKPSDDKDKKKLPLSE